MYREKGLMYYIIIIVVILIIAVSGVMINKIIGKNGVVKSVATVESTYKKEDILDKINYNIRQKFIELNNQAKESNQRINDLFNSDVVINYLKEKEIICDSEDGGKVITDSYDIIVENLYDESDNFKTNYKYVINKVDNVYIVYCIDENGEKEEIGELQIEQI